MDKLSPSQIVAVVVRLFAIGLVYYAIRSVGGWIAFYRDYGFQEILVYLTTGLIVPLFLAAFLWKFPFFVATRLLKGDGTSIDHGQLTVNAIYTVGFVLLGFLLLFWAVSDLVYWAIYFVNVGEIDAYNQSTFETADPKAATVATLVEFVMALCLIFGSRQLSAFISKVRHEH